MNEEAIKKLKNILVEVSENDDSICYVTSDDADALKAAIQALELVNNFETAQIITGGRLNGRTYAYKCGLADGQRLAKGEKIFDILKTLPPVTPKGVTVTDFADRCRECGKDIKQIYISKILDKVRAELIQSIQNGTLKIESGNEELFRIIDKYKENKEQESVLDKISAEIMQLDYDIETVDHDYDYRYPHLNMAQIEEVHLICREEVLQIINEYKEESEKRNEKM